MGNTLWQGLEGISGDKLNEEKEMYRLRRASRNESYSGTAGARVGTVTPAAEETTDSEAGTEFAGYRNYDGALAPRVGSAFTVGTRIPAPVIGGAV